MSLPTPPTGPRFPRDPACSYLARNAPHRSEPSLSTPVHARIPVFATGVPCSNRRAPLAARKPRLRLLGGIARPNQPETPPSVGVSLGVGEADSEQLPPETAQKPRTHGEIGAHFLRSRGSRKRRRGRNPKHRGGARRRSRGGRCAYSQTNACTGCTANHRAKALMENAGRASYPPLQKATLIHPRQPGKQVTHNCQKSPWRAVIPRSSIVKCSASKYRTVTLPHASRNRHRP